MYRNSLNNFKVIVGMFLDLKVALALKKFFLTFGCSNIYYSNYNNSNNNFDFRYFFLLNKTLSELEILSFILFVSINLRLEAPLLNARIRKQYLYNSNNMYLFSIGLALSYLTYPVKNIGNSIKTFLKVLQGKARFFCDLFFKHFNTFSFLNDVNFSFVRPFIMLGCSLVERFDFKNLFYSFHNHLYKYFEKYNIAFVSSTLGFLSFCDLALNKLHNLNLKNICYFFFNEDNMTHFASNKNFYIYQGFIMPKTNLFFKAHLFLLLKVLLNLMAYF